MSDYVISSTDYAISSTDYAILTWQKQMQILCQKKIEEIREKYCSSKADRALAEQKFDRIIDEIDACCSRSMTDD